MADRNGAPATVKAYAGRGLERSASANAGYRLLIANHSSITAAYGAEAAEAGILSICQLAQAILGGDVSIIREGPATLLLAVAPGAGRHDRINRALGALLEKLNALHISHRGATFHLAVTTDAPLPGVESGADASRVKADMEITSGMFAAMQQQRLFLAWQSVCAVDGSAEPLYHEALTRIAGADGSLEAPANTIQAMERLGLIRAFDRHVVLRVIAELEACLDIRLAVNISVQSARLDGWWDDIVLRLSERPDIAHRLIIEITETATPTVMSEIMRFLDRMRRLGCRIALDDFGVGHASFRQLHAIAPDIVKVDALFLHRAEASSMGRAALRHLVGLAGTISDVVIVEGVETKRQRELATEAGAFWLQGYLFGRPALMRPWRQDDAAKRILALRHFADSFANGDDLHGDVAP